MLKTNKSSSSICAGHVTSVDEGSNSGVWGEKIHFYRAGHKLRDLRSASPVLWPLDPGTLVRPNEVAGIKTGTIERW